LGRRRRPLVPGPSLRAQSVHRKRIIAKMAPMRTPASSLSRSRPSSARSVARSAACRGARRIRRRRLEARAPPMMGDRGSYAQRYPPSRASVKRPPSRGHWRPNAAATHHDRDDPRGHSRARAARSAPIPCLPETRRGRALPRSPALPRPRRSRTRLFTYNPAASSKIDNRCGGRPEGQLPQLACRRIAQPSRGLSACAAVHRRGKNLPSSSALQTTFQHVSRTRGMSLD